VTVWVPDYWVWFEGRYFCHGHSIQTYWCYNYSVLGHEMPQVLNDDYVPRHQDRILPNDGAKLDAALGNCNVGDILIFYKGDEIIHSARISGFGSGGKTVSTTRFTSKNGYSPCLDLSLKDLLLRYTGTTSLHLYSQGSWTYTPGWLTTNWGRWLSTT